MIPHRLKGGPPQSASLHAASSFAPLRVTPAHLCVCGGGHGLQGLQGVGEPVVSARRSAPRAARRGATVPKTRLISGRWQLFCDFAKDAAPRGHSACVVCSAHAAPREVDHARGWHSPANRASMHALERPIGSPVSDTPIEGVPFRCVGAFGSRRGQAACGCGEAPMTVKC